MLAQAATRRQLPSARRRPEPSDHRLPAAPRPAPTAKRRWLEKSHGWPALADDGPPEGTLGAQADKSGRLSSARRGTVPAEHFLQAAPRPSRTDKRRRLPSNRRRPVPSAHRPPAAPSPAPTKKRRRLTTALRQPEEAHDRLPEAPSPALTDKRRRLPSLAAGRCRRTTVYRRRGISPRRSSAAG